MQNHEQNEYNNGKAEIGSGKILYVLILTIDAQHDQKYPHIEIGLYSSGKTTVSD